MPPLSLGHTSEWRANSRYSQTSWSSPFLPLLSGLIHDSVTGSPKIRKRAPPRAVGVEGRVRSAHGSRARPRLRPRSHASMCRHW